MTSSLVLPPPSLEHSRFAVVDVETTGGRGGAQNGGRILEVAVAILEGGTVHLAFEALLDPGIPIPPWVARLTGITDGLVVGRPRFEDVAAGLGRALEAGVFVAHNARFDWRFLAVECATVGVPAPVGKPLCTVRLTRRLVPELRHRGLDHVAAFFGVDNPARHRACGAALGIAGWRRWNNWWSCMTGRGSNCGLRNHETRKWERGTRNSPVSVVQPAIFNCCSDFRVP